MLRKWILPRRFGLVALALSVFLAPAPSAPLAPAAAPVSASSALPTAAEIDSVLHELSSITGFKIRRQLPFALITRDQINHYVKEQIRSSVKPDEIRAEEMTLKKFGFAPANFDLRQTTIDLLTEQAAAFYDYRRRKLFISDWATVNMRDAALIHELAHALADQNFSIRKYLGNSSDDSEISMARNAVVEGQASWLMLEVSARRGGHTLADSATAGELLAPQPDSDDSSYPVFRKAPLYIRRTLMFPYDQGELFQQAVFLHEGQKAFSNVFLTPPVSTAQILHPDRYFNSVAPAYPDLPKPARHAKPFVTGTLGELETRILLEQYIGPETAEKLGPMLRGSEYRLDEVKPDHRMTLTYISEWTDEDSASQYFKAYETILGKKWSHVEATADSPQVFSGKSEDGYFHLVRNGVHVLSEEGFPDPL
jgi:hypothetical protein